MHPRRRQIPSCISTYCSTPARCFHRLTARRRSRVSVGAVGRSSDHEPQREPPASSQGAHEYSNMLWVSVVSWYGAALSQALSLEGHGRQRTVTRHSVHTGIRKCVHNQNTWIVCVCDSCYQGFFSECRRAASISGLRCLTKAVQICCDMKKGRLLHVPAIYRNGNQAKP